MGMAVVDTVACVGDGETVIAAIVTKRREVPATSGLCAGGGSACGERRRPSSGTYRYGNLNVVMGGAGAEIHPYDHPGAAGSTATTVGANVLPGTREPSAQSA